MDSDFQLHHHHLRLPPNTNQQQQQMNSGLTRYRSAPSSYFADILNGIGGDDSGEFLNHVPSSPETDRFFARFMSTGGTEDSATLQRSSGNETMQQPQYMAPMMRESEIHHLPQHHHHQQHQQQQQQQQQQQSDLYSSNSHMIYQNQTQPSVPNHNSATTSSAMDDNNSCRGGSSIALDHPSPPSKISGGGNSSLIRHSSSPAGLFANINVDTGYGATRAMGNFQGGNTTANSEAPFHSAGRLKGQTDFSSSGPPSSSGLMTGISETGGKSMGVSGSEDGSFGDGGRDSGGSYITGFPVGSWDDSSTLSNSYLKGLGVDTRNTMENQECEGGNRPPTRLSHHLSLPTSSAELLQFQDAVPWKIRAKRGCATHPRSIAERVRRTRISERMRKLQELVPNMDKQTNTSDMLDLAVDYIKDLQQEVKVLSNKRAKCTCSNK